MTSAGRLSYVRLTLPQVAERLRTSKELARELVVRGPIDGIKSGSQVVVELGALRKFQERRLRS